MSHSTSAGLPNRAWVSMVTPSRAASRADCSRVPSSSWRASSSHCSPAAEPLATAISDEAIAVAAIGFWTLTMCSVAPPCEAARSAAADHRAHRALAAVGPHDDRLEHASPLSARRRHGGYAPATGSSGHGRSIRRATAARGRAQQRPDLGDVVRRPSGSVTVPRSSSARSSPWNEMWARPSQTT